MIEIKYGKRKVINYRGAKKVIGGLTANNKVSILLYISKELAQIDNDSVLRDRILELSNEIFEPDNVTLRLWEPEELKVWGYLKETNPPRRDLKYGEGFSGQVFAEKKTHFHSDLSQTPGLLDHGEETRCVMCVPILDKEEAIGTISIESNTAYFYVQDDVEILEAMAAQIALALKKVRLVTGLLDASSRLESDMRLGRTVQEHIVSKKINPWNGIYTESFYEPMVEVSGDYFDSVMQKDSMTVLMADVSGHGVPAALITMVIHFQFKRCVGLGLGLRELLVELSDSVMPKLPAGTYFTAQIVRIFTDNSFVMVNAGHPKLVQLHYQTRSVSELDAKGIPLGIAKQSPFDYEERYGRLEPGDMLVLMTDGFSETRKTDGNEIGTEFINNSFLEALAASNESEPQAKISSILNGFISQWQSIRDPESTIEDDLSMLTLQLSLGAGEATRQYQTAKELFADNRLQEALEYSHRAYGLEKTLVHNLSFLAKELYNIKNYRDCIRFLQEYINTTYDLSPNVLYWLGLCYFYIEEYGNAQIQLTRALAMSPGYYQASLLLVRCYILQDRPLQAAEVLQRGLKYAPNNKKLKAMLEKLRRSNPESVPEMDFEPLAELKDGS